MLTPLRPSTSSREGHYATSPLPKESFGQPLSGGEGHYLLVYSSYLVGDLYYVLHTAYYPLLIVH